MGFLYGLCSQCHGTFIGEELYQMPMIFKGEEYTRNVHVCQSCRDASKYAVLVKDEPPGMCINCKGICGMGDLHEMPAVYVGPLVNESYVQMAFFCGLCRKKHIDWAIKAIDEYKRDENEQG